MDTPDIVRRLLSRPVTKARALKVLHLLDRPEQRNELTAALGEYTQPRLIVEEALSESVVTAHFARRTY